MRQERCTLPLDSCLARPLATTWKTPIVSSWPRIYGDSAVEERNCGPNACRQVLMRSGPIRREGRVRLCLELPLLELPARNRVGVQVFRGNRAREAEHH